MPHPARKRRQSSALAVDPLEVRKLLSRTVYAAIAPAVPHAEVSDRDDGRGTISAHTSGDQVIATSFHPSTRAITAEHDRIESVADDETPHADPGRSVPLPSAGTEAPDWTSYPTEMGNETAILNENISCERQADPRWRGFSLSPAAMLVLPNVSSGIIDAFPATSDGHGKSIAETSSSSQLPAEIPDVQGDADLDLPKQSLLIPRPLPFSSEILTRAMDALFNQLDGSADLDEFGALVTQRIAAVGSAFLAATVAFKLVRRLHPANSEREINRSSTNALVPGLKPARST